MPDNNHSNTRIKKLSPLLINQLAAGEVVTRPSAVVKELLENAIDAGATDIEVRITQGGMGMIEVVDNGVGIYPNDIVMAITRHATSKVADIANLHGISTLGFRGEALAATAAVSRLTLTSSHDDSGIGRQLQVAGVLADTPKLVPIVHNQGTTVTVKDLYFNVPARRGNLKSIGTEFTHIETIVREVALARADITLSLYHDHKKRLTLSATSISSTVGNTVGSNENYLPLSRLEQALGLPLADNALEIMVDLSSLLHDLNASSSADDANKQANISGWLWPVVANQTQQVVHTSLPKLLYVNGRLVKESLISNQLRQIATSAQLDGIGYALYFELPTHWLNINVHPTKQRIKISPLNNVMAHLSHAIRLKLKNAHMPPVLNSSVSLTKYVNTGNVLNATSFKDTNSGRKVQTPRYEYHSAAKNRRSKKPSEIASDFNFENIPSSQSAQEAKLPLSVAHNEVSEIVTATVSLPYCLEVIKVLSASDLSASYGTDSYQMGNKKTDSHQAILESITESNELSSLSWLLFYSQGQLLLTNEQEWQKEALQKEVFQKNWQTVYENNTPVSAAVINQQITNHAEQLSMQQLAAFKANLEQALRINAHAVISTEQLFKVMLLSASS